MLLPGPSLVATVMCSKQLFFVGGVGIEDVEHTESSPMFPCMSSLLLVLSREPLSGLPNSFPGISSGQWLPCLLPPSLLASMPVGVSGLDSSSFPLLSQYLAGLVGGSPNLAQVPGPRLKKWAELQGIQPWLLTTCQLCWHSLSGTWVGWVLCPAVEPGLPWGGVLLTPKP